MPSSPSGSRVEAQRGEHLHTLAGTMSSSEGRSGDNNRKRKVKILGT